MSIVEPPILFIGGTGRCGTSILREVLGAHSSCGVLPFEYRFLIDPDGIVDFYSSSQTVWSPYNQDLRLKRLYIFLNSLTGKRIRSMEKSDWLLSEEQYKGWNLQERIEGFEGYIEDLLNELINFKFNAKWVGSRQYDNVSSIWFSHYKDKNELLRILQSFCWKSISKLLLKLDKKIYVEDNTWNLIYSLQLLDLFPHAKFVHIYRNPLDVISSFIKQPWCPSDIMEAAEFYASLMDRWNEVKQQLPNDRYFEFAFEKMVDNPKQIYEKICSLLNLKVESEMLDIKIHSGPVGKWRQIIPVDYHQPLKDRLENYIAEYS